MKAKQIKAWQFWLLYIILIVALLVSLNGCAVTRPADMSFAKGLRVEKHKPLNVIHCNRE